MELYSTKLYIDFWSVFQNSFIRFMSFEGKKIRKRNKWILRVKTPYKERKKKHIFVPWQSIIHSIMQCVKSHFLFK